MSTLGNTILNGVYTGGKPGGLPEVIVFDAADYTYETVSNFNSNACQGVAVSKDGKRAVVCSAQGLGNVREYSLATPYMINTTSLVSSRTSITNGYGCRWSDDGSKFYIMQDNGATELLHQWSCPNLFKLNGYTKDGTYNIGILGAPRGFSFNPAGTFMYVGNGSTVSEFSLTVPWDVTSGTVTHVRSRTFSVSTAGGCEMSADGTKLMMTSGTNAYRSFNMTTPFDIDPTSLSAAADSSKTGHANNDQMGGISMQEKRLYIPDFFDDIVYQYKRA